MHRPATKAGTPELAAAAVLGQKPLCEASGAVLAPCIVGDGACLLVVDNENAQQLFEFDIDGERLVNQRPIPIRSAGAAAGVKDGEGLAWFGDSIFMMGSHSRRSWDKVPPRCTRDPKRLVFGLLRPQGDHLDATLVRTDAARWEAMLQPAGCRSELFTPADASARATAAALCEVIAAADPHAEESSDACWSSINFEGVGVVPDEDGRERIWFGLRSPVVGKQAILVRLASTNALRFDALVALNLDGNGVRDLTYAAGALWVLAGPPGDVRTPGSIWRLPSTALADGAQLRPDRFAVVPPYSEALVIDPPTGQAFVLIDGDEEKGDGHENGCPEPARYLSLTLPVDDAA